MFDKRFILKGISQPEEKLLLAKILDQAQMCSCKKELTFTEFIDPAKRKLFESMIYHHITDLNVFFYGGMPDCERVMIGFAPLFMELSNELFPIKIVEIKKNKKFSEELSHRDYLGSILGLGIDRGKIGDIILLEDKTICFAQNEIAQYICSNLEKVSRTNVFVDIIQIEDFCAPEKQVLEKNLTVASLRLDAVTGAVFHISRSKSQSLIEAEKAAVNWSVITQGSAVLKEGDLFSIRGLGRVKIIKINGKTRKDRISIIVHQYI